MAVVVVFFFNDTAPTEISPFPLRDPLPSPSAAPPRTRHRASRDRAWRARRPASSTSRARRGRAASPPGPGGRRSEEHTSELQSPCNLVCRLLLEKKKPQQLRIRLVGE